MLNHSPKIVTDGLVFYYDMNNTKKSWKGVPTTNLIGDGMSIYNNVSSDVSALLETTGEYYRGASIYKLTLTPTTASGVSYLTAGNNPGIGVVTGGGGGTANRYTGHAIFYKPTVIMHSVPIFTNYSNIPGWGAGSIGSNRSYSMEDGWFRSEVLWYDTVTRSDGKYWAINPANAVLNIPIVIYWAGPFKEDRNDSTFVSRYTTGTRSNIEAILDLTGQNTITASSLTYNSDGSFSFNNANDVIETSFPAQTLNNSTICAWVYDNTADTNYRAIVQNNVASDDALYVNPSNYLQWWPSTSSTLTVPRNQWTFVAASHTYGSGILYQVNSTQQFVSGTFSDPTDWDFLRIGGHSTGDGERWGGKIPVVNVYNRALTAAEVQQNFNALRGRYGGIT